VGGVFQLVKSPLLSRLPCSQAEVVDHCRPPGFKAYSAIEGALCDFMAICITGGDVVNSFRAALAVSLSPRTSKHAADRVPKYAPRLEQQDTNYELGIALLVQPYEPGGGLKDSLWCEQVDAVTGYVGSLSSRPRAAEKEGQ
jgi:hypothetical protein